MAFSQYKVTSDIFKVLKGVKGRSVFMYDSQGKGPVASPENAKWIFVKPDNILISLPKEGSSEEIFIYRTTGKSDNDFKDILNRIRRVTLKHRIGITLMNYEQSVAAAEMLSHIRREIEELEETVSEEQPKNKYLVEFRQLLQSFTKVNKK